MPLAPVARRSVPDEVYDQLLGELVGGGLSCRVRRCPASGGWPRCSGVCRPGGARGAAAAGPRRLVEVRQGGSTTVARLPSPRRARPAAAPAAPRWRDRPRGGAQRDGGPAHVGPKIAELAAARGGPRRGRSSVPAVQAIRDDADPVGRQQCALVFWEHLVEAADSVAFRLMFNSMRAAYVPMLEALAVVMAAEVDRVDAYDALATAIADRDADPGSRAGRGPARRRHRQPARRDRQHAKECDDADERHRPHRPRGAGRRREPDRRLADPEGDPGQRPAVASGAPDPVDDQRLRSSLLWWRGSSSATGAGRPLAPVVFLALFPVWSG